jgi:hypothetical protein
LSEASRTGQRYISAIGVAHHATTTFLGPALDEPYPRDALPEIMYGGIFSFEPVMLAQHQKWRHIDSTN